MHLDVHRLQKLKNFLVMLSRPVLVLILGSCVKESSSPNHAVNPNANIFATSRLPAGMNPAKPDTNYPLDHPSANSSLSHWDDPSSTGPSYPNSTSSRPPSIGPLLADSLTGVPSSIGPSFNDSTSSRPPSASAPACAPKSSVVGVNLAGAETSWEPYPNINQIHFLKTQGIHFIRLPNAWERLQPVLMGPLERSQIQALKNFLSLAANNGIQVVIDIHNNGHYDTSWATEVAYGEALIAGPTTAPAIGTAAVPIAAFVDLWTKLAATLAGHPGIAGYDIMNKPNNLPNAGVWPKAAQGAINAIRSVDPKTVIIVEGDHWANAQNWALNNPKFPLNDPANRIVYEAHQYFDDGSGNYNESYDHLKANANRGVHMVRPFVQWLQAHQVPGYIGEFGIPSADPRWQPVMENFLKYLLQNKISATYWNLAYDEPQGENPWWLMISGGSGKIGLNSEGNGDTPTPQWPTLQKFSSGSLDGGLFCPE